MTRKRRATIAKGFDDQKSLLPVEALDAEIATPGTFDGGLGFSLAKNNLWISPGGKVRLAKMLLGMLKTSHNTYSEVFAGSAAVFFRKEKVQTEVLNDRNEEIANSYILVQSLNDQEIGVLSKMSWVGDRGLFKQLGD